MTEGGLAHDNKKNYIMKKIITKKKKKKGSLIYKANVREITYNFNQMKTLYGTSTKDFLKLKAPCLVKAST